VLAALSILPNGAAQAGSIFDVVSAAVDPTVYGGGGGHSFWIPGIATDLDFVPAGTLDVAAASWHLTGSIEDGSLKFDVDITFSDIMNYNDAVTLGGAPTGTPKLELFASAYAPVGPVDPTTWMFASTVTGTLTGTGAMYNGLILDVERMGPAAQMGAGANGKNTNDGLSTWLYFSVADAANTQFDVGDMFRGDINVDIEAAPVPEPSAAVVFGLGALIVRHSLRRKRS
jgi:hypothetical protein